jgi:predicted glycosyltransferase
LRRCRTIAHALVERNRNMSVLILTGSPIVGSFDFRARVDFVRVPGVIKLRNGEYTSLSLHIDIENTIALRESIIQHTAESFDPDIFIVDKEPLGLRGEVNGTLQMLKARGTPLVLGLRDVMDEPAALAPEWARKKVIPALRDLYDQIWVYGLPEICDPVEHIALPRDVRRKVVYTGYLKRNTPKSAKTKGGAPLFEEPYLLVTAGGGGDGEEMIDWVLRAYEYDRTAPHPALIVFGPFMNPDSQTAFAARAERLPRVRTITFDTRIETLMSKAAGVVAMGGYNTFCEILSFDKPAIIVPRTKPRREQFIRAQRAEQLGMVRMLSGDSQRNARAMAEALRALPGQARPSQVVVPGLLDGLGNVDRLAARLMGVAEALPKVAV